MPRIKTAADAVRAYGLDGTNPIPGVLLIERDNYWTVHKYEFSGQGFNWVTMESFSEAAEVVEWANRF